MGQKLMKFTIFTASSKAFLSVTVFLPPPSLWVQDNEEYNDDWDSLVQLPSFILRHQLFYPPLLLQMDVNGGKKRQYLGIIIKIALTLQIPERILWNTLWELLL